MVFFMLQSEQCVKMLLSSAGFKGLLKGCKEKGGGGRLGGSAG